MEASQKARFAGLPSRLRREAQREALQARLTIIRDNVAAVRTSNRVMNNVAINQIMTAAEDFIKQIREMQSEFGMCGTHSLSKT